MRLNWTGETPSLVAFESYWTGIIDEFILLWEFGSCPCRCQNQDWVCVSFRWGGQIGCKASQVRARNDGFSCPPYHPRSPPCRECRGITNNRFFLAGLFFLIVTVKKKDWSRGGGNSLRKQETGTENIRKQHLFPNVSEIVPETLKKNPSLRT